MKRKALLKHLREQGCELLREGGRHSWWYNPGQNLRSAVPRHNEISDILANKICKDQGACCAYDEPTARQGNGPKYPDLSLNSYHYVPQNHAILTSLPHLLATIPLSPTGS